MPKKELDHFHLNRPPTTPQIDQCLQPLKHVPRVGRTFSLCTFDGGRIHYIFRNQDKYMNHGQTNKQSDTQPHHQITHQANR